MNGLTKPQKMVSFLFISILVILAATLSASAAAEKDIETVKKQVDALSEQLDEMNERMDKAEMHTETDRLSWGVELRSRVDSIHYKDINAAPDWLMNSFFGDFQPDNYNVIMGAFSTGDFTAFRDLAVSAGMVPPGTPVDAFASVVSSMMTSPEGVKQLLPLIGGFNGVTKAQAQQLMAMMRAAGVPADKYDADNDAIWTNKLRLNMKANVNKKLSFTGRLAMYKAFGDSSSVKWNTGSLGDVYMDGNTASLPQGDILHVERAFFNVKHDFGRVPTNFSLGRRPATDGAPLEYGNYSLEGGSPMASIINWQFDGASLSFDLENVTKISGSAFKLCWGVGFESDWGNSYSLNGTNYTKDAMFGGFIADLYNDDVTKLVLNYAHAWNITDGFTGTTVMPFIPVKNSDGTYSFEMNTGGWISRTEGSTNIGDFDLASLVVRSNFEEWLADIDTFLAVSWSHTSPDQVSRNPFFELMGHSLVSTADANGNLESQDGTSIYTGIILPMPLDARMGLEYNWGSKYWFNMTGAEDSLIGSKLATRGQVFETYYIQPVFDDNFFVKLGGQYYDYEYTGSGNPMGEPVKIDDMTALDALFPVVDEAWNVYLSMTLRY